VCPRTPRPRALWIVPRGPGAPAAAIAGMLRGCRGGGPRPGRSGSGVWDYDCALLSCEAGMPSSRPRMASWFPGQVTASRARHRGDRLVSWFPDFDWPHKKTYGLLYFRGMDAEVFARDGVLFVWLVSWQRRVRRGVGGAGGDLDCALATSGTWPFQRSPTLPAPPSGATPEEARRPARTAQRTKTAGRRATGGPGTPTRTTRQKKPSRAHCAAHWAGAPRDGPTTGYGHLLEASVLRSRQRAARDGADGAVFRDEESAGPRPPGPVHWPPDGLTSD